MRRTWLGKNLPFEWRLGIGLLIALVATCAASYALLTQLDQDMAEEAIRECIQEAKAEAQGQREPAGHKQPPSEERLPPPAGAGQPVDFEDVARLRSDPEYRATALKWAEAEEARRAKNRRPQEETPQQLEEAAASCLETARRLEAEGFPSKAQARYREIVDKYPKTQAAKEAAQALEPKKQPN